MPSRLQKALERQRKSNKKGVDDNSVLIKNVSKDIYYERITVQEVLSKHLNTGGNDGREESESCEQEKGNGIQENDENRKDEENKGGQGKDKA